jgi:hypothetical protein
MQSASLAQLVLQAVVSQTNEPQLTGSDVPQVPAPLQ